MSKKVDFQELLEAGVHFGHLRRKWNPKMAPYIFMERNGIHIIDLHKTAAKLEEAASALSQIAKSGKKIMFVATKKQAKTVVEQAVKGINMPYVTERWPGGMLTNFVTIRKAIRKMAAIDKMGEDGTMATLSKRERLQISRQRAKLEKNLGSIADLTRLPAAIFVVDIMKEHIAIAEAKKLGIPVDSYIAQALKNMFANVEFKDYYRLVTDCSFFTKQFTKSLIEAFIDVWRKSAGFDSFIHNMIKETLVEAASKTEIYEKLEKNLSGFICPILKNLTSKIDMTVIKSMAK